MLALGGPVVDADISLQQQKRKDRVENGKRSESKFVDVMFHEMKESFVKNDFQLSTPFGEQKPLNGFPFQRAKRMCFS